ncbi:hypothetical protein QS257_05115 [Terrilactibacillus sp. S3-3]|nr:hypothetical protein QS257_05115 [Terrilactibacillus sp. S3-3]
MEEDRWTNLEEKMKDIDTRLKNLEERSKEKRPLIGGNIWVLVPVVAIIMWGLQRIFVWLTACFYLSAECHPKKTKRRSCLHRFPAIFTLPPIFSV